MCVDDLPASLLVDNLLAHLLENPQLRELAGRRGLQFRSFRYDSKFHVTPQIDDQSSRHGHDADPPHPLASFGKSLLVPLTQLAVGLEAEPCPGNLDE